MTEFLRSVAGIATTIFVVLSMANVGLTQKPQKLLGHLRSGRFLTRMVVVNFTIVPALMFFAVHLTGLNGPTATALIIFSTAAGAPLLIKLTAKSKNDIAAGATVQMVLMVATIAFMPLILPRLLDGASISAWAITQPLLQQMLLPLVVGMALFAVVPQLVAVIQPWIAAVSNIALYVLLSATILGYLDALREPALWQALAVGVTVLSLSFLIGHGLGEGRKAMRQIGGLGTAQRNTAAALIASQSAFADEPVVFVTVSLLNTVMMVVLLGIAGRMAGHSEPAWLQPMVADPPQDDPAVRSAGA